MKLNKHISLDSIQGLEEIKDSAAESCRGGFFFSGPIAVAEGGGAALGSVSGTTTFTSSDGTTTSTSTSSTVSTTDPDEIASILGGLFS